MTIPYGKQEITAADIAAVTEALQADFLTQGPRIKAFEDTFAEYVDAQYAVAVSNGTAALHLSVMALGLQPGQKVITSPITFAASANCVRYCGGEVAFADIDPSTALLDINAVRQLLEAAPPKTYSGIITVDFAGYPVDLQAFRELADEHGLWLLQDACHSPGGYFTDRSGAQQPCGNGHFADLAIFSFHPVKHIACGEGGMITTSNSALYEQLMMLRTHGITKDPSRMKQQHGGWYYEMQQLGYNYRLTDIQSALGLSQLARAKEGLERRRAIARKYDAAFADRPIRVFAPAGGVGHAYHLYVIHVNNRKELYDALRSRGIFAQVHYIPLHTMPYYRQQGFEPGMFPQAEAYYEGCLSLPMYPSLSDEEQDFVIEKVLDYSLCVV
ncbi:MAG: UDP-4-amino-4,6-dideoxy-N-acetyl-beta-L-altrosamine transaminase [Bacteroidota bacterium]